ncbi:MAG TPA: DNA polymerase III subunit gamma/tau [Candidatus Aphodovivens avistercoris]|nr:DNA polymerase III subunit gamma/tau [Candidatus Aphodovivens avistercoris]
MAESLYRKYRPQIFEDVVGQEHIERTLKNAIEQDKVSHAYLFCGPRGTGKTTTARLLAKALLCEKGPTPDPDGTCEDCVMIANGAHPDVNELDAASRTGVENVREEIIGRVQFAPTRGHYKVYIIDEVHMLSNAAFNALLKTLEEPPSHVVFILCTTDPQQVPETIHSRCQRFDFHRISNEALVSRLGAVCVAEGVEFEGEALDLIAHRAEGGMRNALTSLEQVMAFSEGGVTLEAAERMLGSLDASDLGEIVGAIGRRDAAACFRWTAEFVETGADLAQFSRELARHVRNLYVASLAGAEVALEVGGGERREIEAELPLFGTDRLARILGVLGELCSELKTSTNPRLSFEIALTRMVRPDSDLTLEALAERVEALESGYSAVAHVVSAPAAGGAAAPVTAAVAQPRADAGFAAAGAAGRAAEGFEAVPVAGQDGGAAAGAAFAAGPAREQRRSGGAGPVGAAAASAAQGGMPPAVQEPSRAAEAVPAAQVREAAPMREAGAGAAAGSGAGAVTGAAAGAGVSAQLAASLGNPASLQRVWQAALSALKKEKAAYGVLFLNTKAVFEAAAGALVIEFPAENAFAFKAAQKPEVQDAVAAALVRACGEQVGFSYQQGSKRVMAGGSAAAAATPAAGARRDEAPAQAGGGAAFATREPRTAAQGAAASAAASGQDAFAARQAQQARQQAAAARPPAEARPAVQDAASGHGPAADVRQGGFGGASRDTAPAPSDGFADDDRVPYDDDAVPYDDAAAMSYDVPPWEEPAFAPAARPSQAQGAAAGGRAGSVAGGSQEPQAAAPVGAHPASAVQPSASDPSPSAASAARSATAASLPPEPGQGPAAEAPDELRAILEAGFGDGVVIEEMRE